jgi:hypothetical protein
LAERNRRGASGGQDGSLLCSQGNVQDSLENARVFYAIVPRSEDFVVAYKEYWSRLAQQEFVKLGIFESWDQDAEPKLSRARIMAYKDGIPELKDHVSAGHPHDLVLSVQVEYSEMVKVFDGPGAAEAERKVCLMPLYQFFTRLTWNTAERDAIELCLANL